MTGADLTALWRACAAEETWGDPAGWFGTWRSYWRAREQAERWRAKRERVWLQCVDGRGVELIADGGWNAPPEPYEPEEAKR